MSSSGRRQEQRYSLLGGLVHRNYWTYFAFADNYYSLLLIFQQSQSGNSSRLSRSSDERDLVLWVLWAHGFSRLREDWTDKIARFPAFDSFSFWWHDWLISVSLISWSTLLILHSNRVKLSKTYCLYLRSYFKFLNDYQSSEYNSVHWSGCPRRFSINNPWATSGSANNPVNSDAQISVRGFIIHRRLTPVTNGPTRILDSSDLRRWFTASSW
jgi:hypothetical protein